MSITISPMLAGILKNGKNSNVNFAKNIETKNISTTNEQKSDSFVKRNKKKILIGGGIAASALVAAGALYLNGAKQSGDYTKVLSNISEGYKSFINKGKELFNFKNKSQKTEETIAQNLNGTENETKVVVVSGERSSEGITQDLGETAQAAQIPAGPNGVVGEVSSIEERAAAQTRVGTDSAITPQADKIEVEQPAAAATLEKTPETPAAPSVPQETPAAAQETSKAQEAISEQVQKALETENAQKEIFQTQINETIEAFKERGYYNDELKTQKLDDLLGEMKGQTSEKFEDGHKIIMGTTKGGTKRTITATADGSKVVSVFDSADNGMSKTLVTFDENGKLRGIKTNDSPTDSYYVDFASKDGAVTRVTLLEDGKQTDLKNTSGVRIYPEEKIEKVVVPQKVLPTKSDFEEMDLIERRQGRWGK